MVTFITISVHFVSFCRFAYPALVALGARMCLGSARARITFFSFFFLVVVVVLLFLFLVGWVFFSAGGGRIDYHSVPIGWEGFKRASKMLMSSVT